MISRKKRERNTQHSLTLSSCSVNITLQYSCLENPMDGGAWQAAVHGVAKSPKRLSDFTFTFQFHSLEKEMASHSSVLAWRIPGTVQPVDCPLWGSTESDTTEATQQQQQEILIGASACNIALHLPPLSVLSSSQIVKGLAAMATQKQIPGDTQIINSGLLVWGMFLEPFIPKETGVGFLAD